MKLLRDISDRWGRIPKAARASICFSAAMFLQKGILSLSTPLFTRIMTQVEYEQYTVYYAWSTILTIVATLNLSSGALNNQLVKAEHSEREIISAFQGLSTIWATGFFIVVVAAYLIGLRIEILPSYLWVLMFLSFIVTPAYEIWTVSKRFKYDYRLPCFFMVGVAVLNLILPLTAVLLSKNKGEAKILATILVNIAVGITFWLFNWWKCHSLYSSDIWKAAIVFNLPLLPHFLSLTILNQSDKIMIERLCEPGQAAIYAVAHTVAAMIQLVMTAMNYSLVPWTYKKLKLGESKVIARRSNQILFTVCCVLGLLMLFSPEVMYIMAPREYREATFIIPAMVGGIFFNYLYQFFGRVEMYHEKTKYMMIGSVACASFNIVLNAVFIRKYGYQAAAYTTLVCQLGLCVMHGGIVSKLTREEGYKEKPYDIRGIITVSAIVILVGAIMLVLYRNTIIRVSMIVVAFALMGLFFRKIKRYIRDLLF